VALKPVGLIKGFRTAPCVEPARILRTMMHETSAVLLVGGMGTRLRALVPSIPKPLASVGNRPFLELLVRQLRNQGIRHLVMCTCHLADQIEREFGVGHDLDVEIKYSKEPYPLGTAGAIKFARHLLRDAADFVVMNGDSLLEIDFHHLIHFHRAHGGLVSMAVTQVEDASRYGTVQVGPGCQVIDLAEKAGIAAPGLVNAGVYVFSRDTLDHIPEGAVSLERDVLPPLLDFGVYALEQPGIFIDIGTPQDYARAQVICDRLFEAAIATNDGTCEALKAGD
jgi:NDP-sugar pyrophosphorylase family protein